MSRNNHSLGSLLFFIGMVCLGGYFRGGDTAYESPNKPKGSIEYIESLDGSQKVILYPDRLEARGFGSILNINDRQDYSIPINEIRSVTKVGQKIRVNSISGLQLELQFNPIFVGPAREFKEAIDSLKRRSR